MYILRKLFASMKMFWTIHIEFNYAPTIHVISQLFAGIDSSSIRLTFRDLTTLFVVDPTKKIHNVRVLNLLGIWHVLFFVLTIFLLEIMYILVLYKLLNKF